MIRYFIFILNLAGIYIFSLLNENIEVKIVAPEQIKPGDEFIMEVHVNKGSMETFARFQQDIPVGFTVTPIKTNNGIFSFKDGKVKLIWTLLTGDSQFVVSYKVVSDPNLSGIYTFNSQFSYAFEKEVKTIELQPTKIIVSNELLVTNDTTNNLDTTSIINNGQNTGNENYCYRKYTKVDNEIIVELKVNKQSVGKDEFAKIQEDIPAGYSVEGLDAKGAIFSFKEQKAKFLWMALPPEDEFIVSYKLISQKPPDISTLNYTGKFSFIVEGNTVNVDIINKDFQSSTYLADNINKTDTTHIVNPVDTSTHHGTIVNPDTNNVVNITSPVTGIFYSVQICALRKYREPKYFNSHSYNLRDAIKIESHDGWNKYTVGKFEEYKKARDYRIQIWNTTIVKDAFVAAYNNGQRITVQEALMIANQKWYN